VVVPHDVTFVEALPLTAIGKVHKGDAAQQFKDYVWWPLHMPDWCVAKSKAYRSLQID